MEIGPGTGALTRQLLDAGVDLDALEIDRDLHRSLQPMVQEYPQLRLHLADALTFDFSLFGSQARLVGNLPYNISSPLILRLFEYRMRDIHILVQREVAQRLIAQPGDSQHGRLSLATALFGRAELLLELPPAVFYPIPQVQSALVRLVPHAERRDDIQDRVLLENLIRHLFAHRRKMLRRSLAGVAADLLPAVELDPRARVQELSLDELVRLSNCMHGAGRQLPESS